MSTTANSQIKTASSANILMCKQWWKVCWMYGDQEKYYRQLYGRKATGRNFAPPPVKKNGVQISELTDDFLLGNPTETNVSEVTNLNGIKYKRKTESKVPSPDPYPYQDPYLLGNSSPETLYGFQTGSPQTPSPRPPIDRYNPSPYGQTTNDPNNIFSYQGEDANYSYNSYRDFTNNYPIHPTKRPPLPPPIIDINSSMMPTSHNGGKFERSTTTVCKNGNAVIVTEEATINAKGVVNANVKYRTTSMQNSPPKFDGRQLTFGDNGETMLSNGVGRDRKGICSFPGPVDGLDCLSRQGVTTTMITVTQSAVKPCNE